MGDHAADGAAIVAAAHGADADPRYAELDLVRVRHAGRLLAAQARAAKRRRHADHVDQRQGLRDLSGGRRRGARCRLGVHGARFCADADPADRGPARRHQTIVRRDREIHRQAADRLARPRPRPDLRHLGLRHRMRPDLVRRLDPRRPAALGENQARPDPRRALQRRDQRHHADDLAPPRIRRAAEANHRRLRPALRGKRGLGPRHGDRRAPLRHRRRAPHQIFRRAVRLHQPPRRGALDRGSRFTIGTPVRCRRADTTVFAPVFDRHGMP